MDESDGLVTPSQPQDVKKRNPPLKISEEIVGEVIIA